MATVEALLLFLHFIGMASLLGGFLVQVSTRPRVVNNAMFHGVLLQLVTGILMVGVIDMIHRSDPAAETVNYTTVGIKLVVLLVITGLVVANRKKEQVSDAVYWAIGLLTVLNLGIAVFAGAVAG